MAASGLPKYHYSRSLYNFVLHLNFTQPFRRLIVALGGEPALAIVLSFLPGLCLTDLPNCSAQSNILWKSSELILL